MDGSPPDASIHGDSPGNNIGVGYHFLTLGSSWPRDRTKCLSSALAGRFFTTERLNWTLYHWVTREAPTHLSSSVQSLSCVRLFATPWTAAHQASLSITNSWSLLKLMSIESVMLSNHLILCCPLLLLPLIFPSIKVFSNESVLWIRQPKYWSFSFSISPSNEYSELISFRMDWLDLLAVQETLKSLLQHHSSKASIFRHSAFLIVQLSHPYVTTVKKPQLWLDRPQCNPLENSSWGYLLYPRSNLAHLVLCLLLGRALSPEEEEESVKELRTSSFLEKNQESYLCIW